MIDAIRTGMREVGERKKIVWMWYGLNLLSAAIVVAPLVFAIGIALGGSLENRRLFDNFDLSWMTEFGWSGQYEQFTVWAPIAAIAAGVFVLITTWLCGGLLAVLRDPADSFFAGCARWFPPFLRLFLLALLGYAVAFGVRAGMGALARKIGEDSMTAAPAEYASMIGFAVFCAAFLFVSMIVDYAKIHMVVTGDRRARFGLGAALRFGFGHFRRVVTIYLVLTGYGLLMLAAYHMWSEVVGQASMGAVLILFLARQLYMFGRTWLRMVFLASEHAYLTSLIPKPAPLPESLEFNESY